MKNKTSETTVRNLLSHFSYIHGSRELKQTLCKTIKQPCKDFNSEFEFNEFEPRLKSSKNRFQLSAGVNLKTLIQF